MRIRWGKFLLVREHTAVRLSSSMVKAGAVPLYGRSHSWFLQCLAQSRHPGVLPSMVVLDSMGTTDTDISLFCRGGIFQPLVSILLLIPQSMSHFKSHIRKTPLEYEVLVSFRHGFGGCPVH